MPMSKVGGVLSERWGAILLVTVLNHARMDVAASFIN